MELLKKEGIRQILERKDGLFRMFMMGKRVNYSARTVVNPDLWLKANEIGIPIYIAQTLTYPERVNGYNYHDMKQAIINGCDIHPGANAFQDSNGRFISLKHLDLVERMTIADQLLSNMQMCKGSKISQSSELNPNANRPKIVFRHLKNNDIVLINRQPTLHKVSIMAHRVKVQRHGKVIRMHYANCNSYNADFDGYVHCLSLLLYIFVFVKVMKLMFISRNPSKHVQKLTILQHLRSNLCQLKMDLHCRVYSRIMWYPVFCSLKEIHF